MNATSPTDPEASLGTKLAFHPAYELILNERDHAHIAQTAAQVLAENPRLGREPPFGDFCHRGLVEAPSLLIEDHSEIQLAHERGADRNLSYRAAMLAGEGDLLAVYGERETAFEAYFREVLGLGDVAVIAPAIANPAQSLAQACLADEYLLETAAGVAAQAGAFNVVPYMATGDSWLLAARIGELAQVRVTLAGPGPRLMRAVNDKLWFTRWATRLLGKKAVPQNRAVYGMAALVGHMHRFMKRHRVIGLKLSHSAASLGNLVLTSEEYASLTSRQIALRLIEAMEQKGWRKPFPLQLVAWEGPLLGSPSVQLWIPVLGEGPPIVEAVFDQETSGTIARFVGGAPSTLGDPISGALVREAMCLGTLFQRLGYFGRCSFDALVVGDDEASAQVHWVECNGRWGGMSLPMTLANRLTGDWRNGGFLVFSQNHPSLIGLGFSQIQNRCDDLLYCRDRTDGVVFLTPGRPSTGGVNCLALARDQATAGQIAERVAARLGG